MNIYQPVPSKFLNKTETFIQRSNRIHNYVYDYSLVIYVGSKLKVKIICKIHGLFEQTPSSHLSGKGCPHCGVFTCASKLKTNQNVFIQQAIKIHLEKYDYSLVEYKNAKTKIRIICKIHGEFLQTPSNHLKGCGCPHCGHIKTLISRRITTEKFIEAAKLMHGDIYDYSLVIYKNAHSKIKLICNVHGIFEQTAWNHLCGNGCPDCSNGRSISIEESHWLESLNNSNIIKQYIITLPTDNKIKVDGYDPSTNTVYEYHGKYWHGHPSHKQCDPDYMIRGKSAGDRYIETLMREIRLKELGYTVISVWK